MQQSIVSSQTREKLNRVLSQVTSKKGKTFKRMKSKELNWEMLVRSNLINFFYHVVEEHVDHDDLFLILLPYMISSVMNFNYSPLLQP